jgi:hypothetical protein
MIATASGTTFEPSDNAKAFERRAGRLFVFVLENPADGTSWINATR